MPRDKYVNTPSEHFQNMTEIVMRVAKLSESKLLNVDISFDTCDFVYVTARCRLYFFRKSG